jgi:hypothetical protein
VAIGGYRRQYSLESFLVIINEKGRLVVQLGE